MGSLNLFPLIVVVIAMGVFDTGAVQIGCSDPNDRCLPIRHCPPVYNRIVKGDHKQNTTFKKELHRKICEPTDRLESKTHICCPKPHIECRLNNKPGACLLREQCPTLRSTTEEELMNSSEQNRCYVHEGKNYFCCTDPYCASIKMLCDRQPSTKHSPSAFPSCVSDSGTKGFSVPEVVCGDQERSASTTVDKQVCCVPPKTDYLISHRNAAKLAQQPCGTAGLVTKIQNGTVAQRGEFPWMVRLVYKPAASCSGTLIHPLYVLTARHCIRPELVKVQLGIHDVRENFPCPTSGRRNCLQQGVQEIKIRNRFRHHIYDVGLLQLIKPATLEGDLVLPICLPVYASLRMHLPTMVTISGWGNTESQKSSMVLMKANTPVQMSAEDCYNKEYAICVGGLEHRNHCPGDSGGPYQAPNKFGGLSGGRYVQYGIISDGPAYCAKPERGSRGVLVGYVLEWILDRMKL